MENIVGTRYGLLVVKNLAGTDEVSRTKLWELECDCGVTVKRSLSSLNNGAKRGRVQSCGCWRSAKIDLNQKYGWLTPIEKTDRKKEGKGWLWQFRCDCGNLTEKYGSEIARNHGAQHCGCKKPTRGPDTTAGHGGITGKKWSSIIYNASRRGLDVEVTIEEVAAIYENQGGRCALSNLPISLPLRTSDLGTASLDRIDSSLGYVRGNVQWLHKDVNRAKSAMTDDAFIALCRAVAQHNP